MIEERLITKHERKRFYLNEIDKLTTLEQCENIYLRLKCRELGIKKTFINYFKTIVNE